MNVRRSRLLWLAAALATGAVLAWAFAPRPVPVEVAAASVGPFRTTIDEDGRTRLRDRYVVSAPLAGRVSRITLRAGDPVQAGAPVATISPTLSPLLDERTERELQARLEGADANVERAAVRIARAEVTLAQARNDASRTEQLAARGFIAPTKLEADRLSVLAAEKERDFAVQDRHVAEHDRAQARAALVAVRQAGTARGSAFVVRAPSAGRVLRIVQGSEATVPMGAPLLEIGDVSQLEVVVELLTGDALRTPAGAPVEIDRWGGPAALEGRVRQVEPAAFTKVSALGVEEQRVNVLIDLVSPRDRWEALGDGYRVGLRIVTQSVDQALQVPVSAVFPLPQAAGDSGPARMAVYVVEQGRVRTVPVDVGARNGVHAWLRSGIEPGTTVIVYPPATVREGIRVRIRPA
jgi:HlyD family secretion protein